MTTTDTDVLHRELQELFREELALSVEDVRTDLFEEELLDSLSFVRLLGELEARYGVDVPLDDLDAETFSTIEKIASYVRRASSG